MSLEDLNERLDLDLPTDADYQTIGGFAFNALGRLPEPGVSFVDRGVGIHRCRGRRPLHPPRPDRPGARRQASTLRRLSGFRRPASSQFVAGSTRLLRAQPIETSTFPQSPGGREGRRALCPLRFGLYNKGCRTASGSASERVQGNQHREPGCMIIDLVAAFILTTLAMPTALAEDVITFATSSPCSPRELPGLPRSLEAGGGTAGRTRSSLCGPAATRAP